MSASTRAPVAFWPGLAAIASLRSAVRAVSMVSPSGPAPLSIIDSRCRAPCPAWRFDPTGDVSWKKGKAGELRAPWPVRSAGSTLWEAGRRAQGDLPACQSQTERDVHRCADLMPAGRRGRREGRDVGAVIAALGVALRGGCAGASAFDRVAPRRPFHGVMQARGRVGQQTGPDDAEQRADECGKQHGEFRGHRSARASDKARGTSEAHDYPKRIQLVMVMDEMPVALITVIPGNRGA